MATVILDPLGRLIRFRRIPVEAPPADGALTVNWTALFGEAGLDEREFVPETPEQRSLVPHDRQFGWRRTTAGSEPLHVTAATLDGRVVEFDASGGGAPPPSRDPMSSGRSAAAEVAIWAVFVSIFAGAGVLARYNLRLGRGDRRGAKRLAIVVVCLSILSGILRAHHVPIAIAEFEWLLFTAGLSLLWGGFAWLIYISLEPHLRRVWPRTLISWTRLLSGQVRDPLVGRDVLIGMFVGVTVMTTLIARFRLSGRAAPSDTLIRALESLSSTPHFANIAFAASGGHRASVRAWRCLPAAPDSADRSEDVARSRSHALRGYSVCARRGRAIRLGVRSHAGAPSLDRDDIPACRPPGTIRLAADGPADSGTPHPRSRCVVLRQLSRRADRGHGTGHVQFSDITRRPAGVRWDGLCAGGQRTMKCPSGAVYFPA